MATVKHRDYLIYMAGPITGLTYSGAQTWREYMAAALPQEIQALSPLRGNKQLSDRPGVIEDCYEDNPLTSTTGITARDRFDCSRADLVVFNMLGATRASLGTAMEFGWADAWRKPIVLIIEESGNVHDHAMIRGVSGFRVTTVDAAIELIEDILLAGKGTPRDLPTPSAS